jgi:hypothetical protein
MAGLDGCGRFFHTGIRSPDRPGRSKSLHRLCLVCPISVSKKTAVSTCKSSSRFHRNVGIFVLYHMAPHTRRPNSSVYCTRGNTQHRNLRVGMTLCGHDVRGFVVRYPRGARNLYLLNTALVGTSFSKDTGGPFPAGRAASASNEPLYQPTPSIKNACSYTSTPPYAFMSCTRTTLPFTPTPTATASFLMTALPAHFAVYYRWLRPVLTEQDEQEILCPCFTADGCLHADIACHCVRRDASFLTQHT